MEICLPALCPKGAITMREKKPTCLLFKIDTMFQDIASLYILAFQGHLKPRSRPCLLQKMFRTQVTQADCLPTSADSTTLK